MPLLLPLVKPMTLLPSIVLMEMPQESVQQMVLSALGIQGISNIASPPWFVDSGASIHMT